MIDRMLWLNLLDDVIQFEVYYTIEKCRSVRERERESVRERERERVGERVQVFS